MTNKKQYSSLDKYNSLDLRAKKTLEFLDKNPAPFKRLNKYVIQRILALTIDSFMINFQKKEIKLKIFSFDREKCFQINNQVFLFKHYAIFIFLWVSILVAYLIFFTFSMKRNTRPITLVFGFEHVDFSVKKNHDLIKNFLADHLNINTFSRKNVFIVSSIKKSNKDIQYLSRLSLYIKLFSCLDSSRIILAIKEHLSYFTFFFKSLQYSRLYSVLAYQIPTISLFSALNKSKLLDNAVCSNSNMLKQPLWFCLEQKKFKTHMFWYSQNSLPHVFHKRNIKHFYPPLQYIDVSFHWIWDNSYVSFLKKVGVSGSFKKCDPIIFCGRNTLNPSPSKENLNIIIFDIFPATEDFYSRYGISDGYYTYKIMTNFILDILKCAGKLKTQKKICIYLKHKRSDGEHVDSRYLDFISELKRKEKIKILDHRHDLKSLIFKANLVITPPYSSPFYIAKSLSVASCFYDPSNTILPPRHFKDDFISTPAILLILMKNSLR